MGLLWDYADLISQDVVVEIFQKKIFFFFCVFFFLEHLNIKLLPFQLDFVDDADNVEP